MKKLILVTLLTVIVALTVGQAAFAETVETQICEIAKQNEKIDLHPFIGWISLYASKEEFELKESICAKEDMDIPEIMEQSVRLMESYQAAIPMFEEDYGNVFKGE